MFTRRTHKKTFLLLLLLAVVVSATIVPLPKINKGILTVSVSVVHASPTASQALVDSFNPITDIAKGLKAGGSDFFVAILNTILGAFGLLLGFAGFLLELVIHVTIVKMHDWVEAVTGIAVAWRVIRDVANIIFVFVLLLIGINMILGSWGESMPFNKKLIPKVIIVALLINFSMFFTKAIIDVSNIVAFEFYKTAQSIGNSTPIPYFPDVKSGLTASIMNGLQVQQIVNDQGKVAIAVTNPTYEFFSVLFAIVVVLVATFVLLVMATLLLIRFILFLFLIITSPVAFVGFLLPQLKSQADKWWKTLSAQAVFAPVFFILMLIVMLIINDPSFHNFLQTLAHSGTATNEASAAQYIANITAIALQYTIVIALLILALISAKQLSGGAAGWAAKLGGKASGIGAFALRNSVGKLGGRIVRSEALGSLVKSDSMVGRAVGKSLILGGNQLQTRSFDARGVKAFGSYAEGSVAQKGGLVGAQKARQERIEARGKIYTQGIASREQREEIAQLRGELADVTQGENETPEKFADRKRKLEEKLALAENTLLEIQGKLTPEREKLLEETQKLSDAERKEADSIISAIEAQQEAISRFKDQAKMGIAGASAKAADAEGKLETFRDRELKGKKFEAYVNIRENVNKIQKGASKARSGAERAYGEIVSGGIFKSTRAAGDALRKGKEKPEDTIAKEVMKALKESTAPTAEAPTTTSATTATPSPGGGESPRAGKEL